MSFQQLAFEMASPENKTRTKEEVLIAIRKLCQYYEQGLLGGERMPEDSNPNLPLSERDNFHYFTLPMALNYQRNSYKLWEAALKTYQDPETQFVFKPELANSFSEDQLRLALAKHKVALQPNRHTKTWRVICETLVKYYDADVRNLFLECGNDVSLVLHQIQQTRKKEFPCLSGQKIANYWLYVMMHYTDLRLKNRHCLSVAPDTHVIQASIELGLIEGNADHNALRSKVASAWEQILIGSELSPIDIHTPLWLWSRKNFTPTV